jgi:ribose-phosphate pyrophosphokinase
MPYLPYGRQDKDIENDATFALLTFAKLVNRLGFESVSCFDAHSHVAQDWFWIFVNVSPDALISHLAKGFDYVCFPDAGAAARYSIDGPPKILARKVRDQSHGKILFYEIENGEIIKPGSSVLVVDDICDGGATFLMLGNALRAYNVRASLYVSHGIFSKGVDELNKFYERIFTTDSRPTVQKGLTVYESAPPHRLLQG